jgi:hypothetical protein
MFITVLFEVTFAIFFTNTYKATKKSQNNRYQGFFLLFLLDDGRTRIRIREVQKLMDQEDCFVVFLPDHFVSLMRIAHCCRGDQCQVVINAD